VHCPAKMDFFRILAHSLCTIFMILVTLRNSEQKKQAINKKKIVFHLILMKLDEVVVIHVYYNFPKFHQNRMQNKKFY